MNWLTGVVEECKVHPIPTGEDVIMQLSAQGFFLYQANPDRVTMHCGLRMKSANFQGLRKLMIPPRCRATSAQFAFDGEVDVLLQDASLAPHYQTALNVS